MLIIHGIGDQQPMQTLRSFVQAVWSEDESIHNEYAGHEVWSKPDGVSKSFELRRLTTPTNAGDIKTDFFEFYWAHLMHGTGYGHLAGWAWTLLWRRPSTVPPGLRLAFFSLWALVALAVAVSVAYLGVTAGGMAGAAPGTAALLIAIASAAFTSLVVPAIGFAMKEIVGDAARYLRPSPQNIQRRHEIRSEGVALLRELHNRGYDRIILVGHSLGSVIGYDVLTYAFPFYNVPVKASSAPDRARQRLERIAQEASENRVAPIEEIQRAQREYCAELAAAGGEWRVTDFITLGSPLAHSAILLAADEKELADKVRSREYPRCLPALEQKIRTDDAANRHLTYGPIPSVTNGQAIRIPHHAAVFALTRWTNLYFPCRLLVFGDLIGGPIPAVLGEGVDNAPVATTSHRGLLTHTLYWSQTGWEPRGGDLRRETVKALRSALDLVDRRAPFVAHDPSEASGSGPG